MRIVLITAAQFRKQQDPNAEVVKTHAFEVVKAEDGTLVLTISSGAVDRDNDTVNPTGGDVSNFLKNPVVLWMHDRYLPPVAKSARLWLEEGRWKSQPEFTPKDMNPFGFMIGEMTRGGFINTSSIGFRPKTWKHNTERDGYDFETWELFEYSLTTIPSNVEAAVQRSKAAGIDVAPWVEVAERVLDGEKGAGFWVSKSEMERIWMAATPEIIRSLPLVIPAAKPDPTAPEKPKAPDAAEQAKSAPEASPVVTDKGLSRDDFDRLVTEKFGRLAQDLKTALTGRID